MLVTLIVTGTDFTSGWKPELITLIRPLYEVSGVVVAGDVAVTW